jgi:hypothetical protein
VPSWSPSNDRRDSHLLRFHLHWQILKNQDHGNPDSGSWEENLAAESFPGIKKDPATTKAEITTITGNFPKSISVFSFL